MTDTTPRDGADLDPDWRGPTLGDSARLLLAIAVLVVLALVLMGATHEAGCGGG